MIRCSKCILPENYPGIRFSENKICNYCSSYKPKKYLGSSRFKKDIYRLLSNNKNRNKSYDCIVGFSGGRDSSYILWYVTKKIGLKAIAYSSDHCFVPNLAFMNMKNISEKLGVELFIEKNKYLKRCIKHHLSSFCHHPSAAMVGVLCTGCKLGIDIGLMNFSRKNNIPLIILGGSPLEVGSYKTGLLRVGNNNNISNSFLVGYLHELRKNPKWILNPIADLVQIQEYYHYYYRRTLKKKTTVVSPFYKYVEWKENLIVDTLNEKTSWQHNETKNTSTWKTDCFIAPLRKYLYKKMLGFNDIDDHLSALIRSGQITRDEAMIRLEKESSVPDEVIYDISSRLGINPQHLNQSFF
jgi:hypothetical protein